ncbi:unnamed protein product [Diabrotica balteata]|uniref:Uncharacterized protein n=1 Tax=Diabrotica balteata TaxID=107213 RepID=A0A9P0DWW8_DIABA|nr:unnamed protein product [Diabrotica balteata]
MAPSPENDNTPKAPDKSDKSKSERIATSDNTKENDKDEKTLSNLNDGELKALLDEAINYKNPKDREGKSKLFKDLLIQAEETERIARATSAGGSEEARHYNPSAARRHHGRHSAGADGGSGSGGHHGGRRHHDRHRKPSSISENMMHGGSLDNLAKEELFLESRQCLIPKMKTVSTRQREGGSLPCDVNSSVINPNIHSFIKEVKKSQAAIKDKEYTTADIETDSENQRLLDNDVLGQNYQESQEITIVPRFTTKATLQIAATPVDEPISFDLDTIADSKKPPELVDPNKVLHSKYSVFFPTYRSTEDRKVDENGNALHQNTNTKTKKKKAQTDKNVVVLTAESVEGHRSDIINDVDKLIQYIGGDKTDTPSGKSSKSNVHKSKQLHKQHASEDSGRGSSGSCKKQRAHSSKGKESRSEIKKSNSLGEISTAKLDDFTFVAPENDDENKVVLRGNKYQSDRPKERRSWGNVEAPSFQILSSNVSTENLEAAENWVVTKTKKKSKKRRNSISSGSRAQNSTYENNGKQHSNRVPSPDFRGKSASSVPQSEKSDTSDADSVHSLPIDGINVPISYADIAKNTEKGKEKKTTPEKPEKVPNKDRSPKPETESNTKKEKSNINITNINKNSPPSVTNNNIKSPEVHSSKTLPAIPTDFPKSAQPPDFNDARNFPAMSAEVNVLKSPPVISETQVPIFPVLQYTENTRQYPPDVNDTKSFPAMPTDNAAKGFHAIGSDLNNTKSFPVNNNNNNNKVLNVEKTNVKNTTVSGKVRNVSPTTRTAPSRGTFNNNNSNLNVKSGVMQNSIGVVHNDIQNDLSILHSNEKESIQFNAQMLPPNIPDVQTIEKMHFMNCHPQQQQPQHIPSPIVVTQHVPRTNHPHPVTQSESTQTCTEVVTSLPSNKNKVDCDKSDRTMVSDSNSNKGEGGEDERPPPVVILSGIGNKEVTGLVFGFDVNEQLLQDDVCNNFVARFVAPEGYTHVSHNHDKIVNFIGSAWEAIINQPNGKVKYYMEES